LTNGIQALRQARENDPVAYIRLIASLLPKQAESSRTHLRTSPMPNSTSSTLSWRLSKAKTALQVVLTKRTRPSGKIGWRKVRNPIHLNSRSTKSVARCERDKLAASTDKRSLNLATADKSSSR
jgi:hypothetical protein